MSVRVMVTGAAGFVGRAVVRELLSRGRVVHALVHQRTADLPAGVRLFSGSILAGSSLRQAMEGCGAVIHLVGIIREFPRRGITFARIHDEGTAAVVAAASGAGAARFVHMSALGTRPDAPSEYHRTKHAAEQHVRNSRLAWTVFRPSLIHGPEGDFMRLEAAMARRRSAPYLFMPYFGRGLLGCGGSGLLQPVFVDDVARAFADAIDMPHAIGRTYDLVGPDRLSWPQLHRICALAITGRQRPVVPVPAWAALAVAKMVPESLLPFTAEQVVMSLEDNVGDIEPLVRDFGWRPRSLEQSLRTYCAAL